jgi:hypothetical protein
MTAPSPEVLEQALRSTLLTEPALAVEQLRERFPDLSEWTIRRVRRDMRRALVTDGAEDTALPLPDLSPAARAALHAGFFRPVQVTLPTLLPTKPLFRKVAEQHVVLPDVHAPFHDPDALDVALQISQAVGPDSINFLGDGMDVSALSSHAPSADRPFRWVDERAQALPVFLGWRAAFPTTRIRYLLGNHERRASKFLATIAPQLQGLWTVREILGLSDPALDFEFPEDNRIVLGSGENEILLIHGTRVRGEAGASVRAEMADAGMSVVMGHVHRLSRANTTRTAQRLTGSLPLVGVEAGCLLDLNQPYIEQEKAANWQQGFVVINIYDNGFVEPELVHIFDGRASFRGRMFESRLRKKPRRAAEAA